VPIIGKDTVDRICLENSIFEREYQVMLRVARLNREPRRLVSQRALACGFQDLLDKLERQDDAGPIAQPLGRDMLNTGQAVPVGCDEI
jgi:hypothetical protein